MLLIPVDFAIGGSLVRYRIVILLSTALIVAGCDRKAEGQSVAIVNGEEITSSELNGEIALANLPATLDKKAATSRILQAMVDRRLLAQQARTDGLDKSPEFISRQRRATEDLLLNMLASRKLNTTKLPAAREIESFEASRPEVFAQREVWNIDQIQYATPTDPELNKKIIAINTLPELAAILDANDVRYAKTKARISSAVVPHAMYAKINALKPGEVFIVPAGQRTVANVIVTREAAPLADDAKRPIAVQALRQEQGVKAMEAQLKDLRAKAKIEYKAGFKPK